MARSSCKTLISLFDTVSLIKPPPPISSNFIWFVSLSSSPTSKKPKPSNSTHDYLTNRHNFSAEVASEVSSSIPFLKNPKNFDSVVSFLMENGFSKPHIEKILMKKPDLFSSKVITIKPRLQILQEHGFTLDEISDLVTSAPWLLKGNVNHHISVLKRVLGSSSNVYKALKCSMLLLKFDLEKFLVPNIDFLKSCGICSSKVVNFVYINPLLFLIHPESLRDAVERVDALGVSRESRSFLYAVQALIAMPREKWEEKVEVFRSLGLSDNEILAAFRRVPLAFVRSESKIKDICQILLRVENVDASVISKHPGLLNFSIEHRIKPRLMVYEILVKKDLFRKKPTLVSFFKLSQQEFVSRYVDPFTNELGDVSSVFKTNH